MRRGASALGLGLALAAGVAAAQEGSTALPLVAARLTGFTPFAFTNPIFVDADGDGRWTAPEPVP